jgi:hypothetical protein
VDAADTTPYEHAQDLAFLSRLRRADIDELSDMWLELNASDNPLDWKQEALSRAMAREASR